MINGIGFFCFSLGFKLNFELGTDGVCNKTFRIYDVGVSCLLEMYPLWCKFGQVCQVVVTQVVS